MSHLLRSRQMVYMLSASLILLLFVLLFSFIFLIPAGKDYRKNKIEYRKTSLELNEVQNFYETRLSTYKDLQSQNIHVINAFDNTFDSKRFSAQSKSFFSSLSVSNPSKATVDGFLDVYEINSSSLISSPTNFYEFIEALNKGESIVELNFPVSMKRVDGGVQTDFCMKVYRIRELNKSKIISE